MRQPLQTSWAHNLSRWRWGPRAAAPECKGSAGRRWERSGSDFSVDLDCQSSEALRLDPSRVEEVFVTSWSVQQWTIIWCRLAYAFLCLIQPVLPDKQGDWLLSLCTSGHGLWNCSLVKISMVYDSKTVPKGNFFPSVCLFVLKNKIHSSNTMKKYHFLLKLITKTRW